MKKHVLDYILVPIGLMVLLFYHLSLVRRILRHPTTTVIGVNAINRRLWVQTMMEDPAKNGILAVQTLRNNIMASTLLASTAIMLCSVIAVLMSSSGGSSGGERLQAALVLGDKSNLVLAVKFFSILLCFMLAFLLNVQSVRYYSHAGLLITVQRKKTTTTTTAALPPAVRVEYVTGAVNKGSYFWSAGLHAFYVSLPLFLWVFGPVPMLASSLVLVCLLHFLDSCSGCSALGVDEGRRGEEREESLEKGLGSPEYAI